MIENPHKSSYYALTRSKTILKRQNKIIKDEVISYLLKHNVLTSFCEYRKGKNRVIVRLLNIRSKKVIEEVKIKLNS
jgi:hypothetical protein